MTRNAPSPAFARNQRTSLKPPAAKRQPPLLKQPNSGVARTDRIRRRLGAVGSISGTTNEPVTTSFAPTLGCVARRLLPMALYWHFPSKDKLIAAVAARIWAKCESTWIAPRAGTGAGRRLPVHEPGAPAAPGSRSCGEGGQQHHLPQFRR